MEAEGGDSEHCRRTIERWLDNSEI